MDQNKLITAGIFGITITLIIGIITNNVVNSNNQKEIFKCAVEHGLDVKNLRFE